MTATLTAIVVLIIVLVLNGARGTPAQSEREASEPALSDPAAVDFMTATEDADLPGAAEMQAMVAAYPTRIDRAEVRDGEWALLMDGEWYYWASGRLLPATLRSEADSYVGIRFYRYEPGPVQMREIDAALEGRLLERTSQQSDGDPDTRERFNDFLDTLYEIASRNDAERQVRSVEFLGRSTRVHPLLVEPLARVERTILAKAVDHPQVGEFLDGLASVHGYNWRNIAGTVRRSYHSYGIAVDLVPYSYRGEWPYWLWAAQSGVNEWWELPVQSRWQIPQQIVDAFEANGFIWGGKWLFFDNLHFEYRPESMIIAERRSAAERLSE